MATYKLLLLAGDGIGPEVMAEVKRLLGFYAKKEIANFQTEDGLVGGAAYDASKESITDATMEKAKAADAVIFGAVGGPKWDAVPYEARPEAGLLRLRKDLGLFANLRPAVCYPALAEVPVPIDLVNVFRPSDQATDVVRQAIAVGARGVWLQEGIVSPKGRRLAEAAGIDYVEDLCVAVIRAVYRVTRTTAA